MEKPGVRFLVPDSADSSTTETVTNVVVSTTITKSPRTSPRKRQGSVFTLVRFLRLPIFYLLKVPELSTSGVSNSKWIAGHKEKNFEFCVNNQCFWKIKQNNLILKIFIFLTFTGRIGPYYGPHVGPCVWDPWSTLRYHYRVLIREGQRPKA